MISPKIAISGFFFIKWMCCSIILLEHNPAMSSLRHTSLESHSKNHQCKHVRSTNMICPEITMADRTYQVCNDVCSESKLQSGRFRAQP